MKKFLAIWIGELISSIGSGMTAFAIAIYVFKITGSATWVSLVTLLAYLPTILLNPIGGILADRYDRRLMMLLGDSLSVSGLILIFICIKTDSISIFILCIGVTISAMFTSLIEPAYKATVTDLLTDDEYSKASGLVQMAGAAKYLISPFVAGFILSVTDISTILIIDMSTFFVTVVTVSCVKKSIKTEKHNTENKGFVSEFKEGFSSITTNKGVRDLVILMGFMCFFIAFIQTLMTPMVLAFADEKSLGIMESVSAIGMLIGSVLIGVLSIKKNYSKVLMVALMTTGVFMALTGTSTNKYVVLVYCILFFTGLPFVNTCADVLIRRSIPNEVQGRAWGIISVLTQIGYVIAYAICGVLADYVFEPMLSKNGVLAGTVGQVIGTGNGRGIGLMLIIAGIVMFSFALVFATKNSIKSLEREMDE